MAKQQSLVKEGTLSLFDTFKQWIVDLRFDHAVKVSKRRTIQKCIQYKAKFYMIQESSFKFKIFRKGDLGPRKTKVSAVELGEAAIFTAFPEIHNLKNYTEDGRKKTVNTMAKESSRKTRR